MFFVCLRVLTVATDHRMVIAEKAASTSQAYTPKFFSTRQYDTESLGPSYHSGGPQIRWSARSRTTGVSRSYYQREQGLPTTARGGIMWLDSACLDRYGHIYLECAPLQQEEILNQIASRKNVENDSRLAPGVEVFSTLRKGTADGFFTSEIGTKYIGYRGNTYLKEFPGCPEIPEA